MVMEDYIMFDKRINIFTGHFGSGKTEVAVNYAVKLSELYDKTSIVDLDIVNPYFRTTDARENLEKRGIWVVTPMYANTNVDVPALPPEVNTLFEKKDYRVVLDIGGDDLGARVVSRYRDEIIEDDYELFFVVNTRRPMTDTLEKIEAMFYEIESSSRLKITKIINNTNILHETTEEVILEGHKLLEKIAQKYDVPIGFVSGMKDRLKLLEGKISIPLLGMDKMIRLPWD